MTSIQIEGIAYTGALYLKGVTKKESAKVAWKSSNKRKCSIYRAWNGKAKRYEGYLYAGQGKVGTITITATYKGRRYTTKVRIVKPAWIDTFYQELSINDQHTFWLLNDVAKKATWKSSDKNVFDIIETNTEKGFVRINAKNFGKAFLYTDVKGLRTKVYIVVD